MIRHRLPTSRVIDDPRVGALFEALPRRVAALRLGLGLFLVIANGLFVSFASAQAPLAAQAPLVAEAPAGSRPVPSGVSTPRVVGLDNGLRVIIQSRPEVTEARFGVFVSSGFQQEPSRGLAELTADLVANAGTRTDGDPASVAKKLAEQGIEIETRVDLDRTNWTVRFPASNLVEAVSLLGRLFREPDGPDFNAARQRAVERQKLSPEAQFERAFLEAIYGSQDAIALRGFDTAVSLDDTVAWFLQWYRPEILTITLTGPQPEEQLLSAVTSAFGSWKSPTVRTPWNGRFDPVKSPTIRRVNLPPESDTVTFRLGRAFDPRSVDLVVLAVLLELWQQEADARVEPTTLRPSGTPEWVPYWIPGRSVVCFGIGGEVPADRLAPRVRALLEAASALGQGNISEEQLSAARDAVAGQDWFAHSGDSEASPSSLVAWCHAVRRCRPEEVSALFQTRRDRLRSVEPQVLAAIARDLIQGDALHLVFAGSETADRLLASFETAIVPIEPFIPTNYPIDGRPLLDRVVAAAGGENLTDLKSLAWTANERSNTSGQVVERKVQAVVVFPNRMRVDYPDLQFSLVVDGSQGWRSIGGRVTDMSPAEVDDFQRSLSLSTTPLLMNHTELLSRELAPDKRRGAVVRTLEVTRPGAGTVLLFIDPESGRVVERENRQVTAQGVVLRGERLEGYRSVEALSLPFLRLRSMDGQENQRIDTNGYQVNVEVPESQFKKPEGNR